MRMRSVSRLVGDGASHLLAERRTSGTVVTLGERASNTRFPPTHWCLCKCCSSRHPIASGKVCEEQRTYNGFDMKSRPSFSLLAC